MPSFKYGARQFQAQSPFIAASTAANVAGGEFQYLPAMDGSKYGTIDFAAEQIKQATLLFPVSVASAASTAAGGSVIIAATQYNSLAASQNSATFFNQAAGSQAAGLVDVSTKMNWTLSPGDYVVLWVNSNTVGVPAAFPGLVLSATVDAVTAQ